MSLLALVLAAAGVARADAPDNWKFKLDGYYRTRGYVFGDLYDGQEKPGTYLQQRLRLQPELNFEDRAKFIMMVDGLDDVVWGDNASLASTSLFAGDPSNADLSGRDIPTVNLKRAWLEFKVPVGVVRVGRQASHWGMGLLANDGNGFDDTFGENHGGNTFDRVLFATKPINVATTIAGKPKDVPLIAAIAVDRLVEDPLIQYYGYSCSVENPDDGCDDFAQHGVTEERDAERRTDSWWVDTEDDVWEMVYALNYKGENLKLGDNLVGDITVGGYAIHRLQGETASDVLVLDAYAKTEIAGVLFEGEIVHIGGETRAITLSSGDEADPYYKRADIWGYVVRGGYQNELFTGVLEHGYASGDDDVTDKDFTGRPLHPDHNVGLLLYDEIIARTTAATWGESAEGLWSQGGVYNSRYLFPNVRVRPLKNWEITGAFLAAWPDRPDGTNVRCATDDGCTQANASADLLGWEVDAAVKHRFHDHILFSMETGYAHATDRLPLKDANLAYVVNDKGQEVGNYFTFQSRVAYEF